MKKMKRLLGLLLSLALVLGMFPGMSLTAYADTETLLITINSTSDFKSGSRTFDNIATVTFSSKVSCDGDTDGWYNTVKSDIILSVTPAAGYTITKVKFYCKKGSAFDETSPFEATLNGSRMYVNGSSCGACGVNQIDVYGYANAPSTVDVTGVTLTPDTAQTIDVGGSVAFTATVAPDGATDKTVKWSVGGTNASAVTLYSDSNCTQAVGADATSTLTVYAKGTSAGSATVTVTTNDGSKTASCNVTVNAATHNVTITAGSNMTKTEGSGAASQTGLSGAMTDVVYTVNDGYYFPEDYAVTAVNGISVTRNSYTQITVSGTPTADAEITLTAPTAKTTPDAPTTAAAVDCTTTDNNDGKLTGVTTAMEYMKSDATEWTAGTGSDITGLVPGTYYVRVKATDTTNASAYQELTIAEYTAPTYTVTYKVVNGTWSDDSTADKTENVQSGSKPASVPTGMKAASGYTGGAWDANPAGSTITGATTFTYSFTALPTYTVTYKVVNGTWSDGTTVGKTETVQSGSKPASVPTGMKASQGFTGGAWDENPADATITGAKTFTYTFTALPTYEVTYKVVNGTWSDDSTTDKTETVQSGSKPASVPTGMKAASGYTGGAWDTDPADATITGAKTFTYTFTAIPTYTVTVTNDGHGTGSAAPVSGAEGTEVTLNATPAEGYAFKEWQVVSGGVTVKDNKFTIGTANVEIKAVFEQAGDMEDEVIVEPGAPAVSGTNIDEVAAGVVTTDEVAAGVKVWVDISPLAEAAVPAGDKALANQAMQGFGGTAGAWIDMSMFKQVTGQNKTAVHQTATAFRFSMKVPDSLKKAGRTFWLLRLHNDKADILATTTGDTLSGETNLFSTYLIAYKDAETPTPTPKPVPQTGDQDHPGLWIILMLIGIAGLTVIGTLKVSRKRK